MTLTLNFQGHSRSIGMVPLNSPYVGSYWWLISNIGPNFTPLWLIRLRNLSDLDFDLSRSFKVKCHGVIGLAIYVFLLMATSNLWPNFAPLRDIRLRNLSDLDFDLSRSFKVKCHGVIGLAIYVFLLMANTNLWPNFARLRDIRLWNLGDLDFDL